MISTTNVNIKKAKDELDAINADQEAQNIARILEFDELDRRLEYSAGVDDGRIEGEAIGCAKGKSEILSFIVQQMLSKDYSIDEISSLTGLSENEVLKMANDLKCLA